MGKSYYSIDEITELYGVNQWTIRMWADRFDIRYIVDTNDGMLFLPQAMEQIGVICRLMKKKMKLEDVRKHLESEFGDCGNKEGKESDSVA